MAEKRKAESIAALFIYNDDDETDEEDEKAEQRDAEAAQRDASSAAAHTEGGAGEQEDRNGEGGVLGMLDYGQEEPAASPEREEGDAGYASIRVEGAEQDQGPAREKSRTPPGSIVNLTPNKAGGTPSKLSPLVNDRSGEPTASEEVPRGTERPSGDAAERSSGEAHPLEKGGDEPSAMEVEDGDRSRKVLDTFLPPPPTENCSDELQEKFARFCYWRQEQGRNINDEMRMSKGYKNPDFMQQAVEHAGIDDIGSCFPKEIFDPHGFNAGDYYDQLALDQRRLNERREQERKQKGQIDFQRGGLQLPPGPPKPVVQLISGQRGIFPAMPLGMGVGIPGLPQMMASAAVVAAAAAPALSAVDSAAKAEPRDRKRSKWDKVEGESARSAQEVLAAAKAHAATIGAPTGSRPPASQSKAKENDGDSKGRSREKGGRPPLKV